MSLLSPFAGPDPDHPRCWRCLMPLHLCACASKSVVLDTIGILHPRLAALRNAVQSGTYADDTGDLTFRRLEFLRWLERRGAFREDAG